MLWLSAGTWASVKGLLKETIFQLGFLRYENVAESNVDKTRETELEPARAADPAST